MLTGYEHRSKCLVNNRSQNAAFVVYLAMYRCLHLFQFWLGRIQLAYDTQISISEFLEIRTILKFSES